MAKKVYLKGEEFVFSRVKGNKESTYRDGDINLTPANIGASAEGHTHDDRYYTESEINTKLNGKANSSHTHGNSDITGIDGSKITTGTIDLARLPQGALERLTIVADDTARFKLTSSTVQKGDTVKVTSSGKMYYVVDETKLSSEAGYEVYAAGTAASVPWSGVTGKPSTYTPSSHTHTKSQITDFPTSMPANGGNAATVGGHTVGVNVPSNAKFTDTTYAVATTSANGLMSKDMVIKLNGIDAGANKTIVDSVLSSNSTNPVQNKVIAAAVGSKMSSSGDSKDCTTTFKSGDSSTGDPTAPAVITSGETHKSLFNKISTAVKNVRWLLSKMGTTDISSIGNGTVTGALSTLNSNYGNLSNKENINAFKNYCPTFATTHGNTAIKDALLVNLNSADGSENRIGYVSNGYTNSKPTDCQAGVREVYYFNKTEVWLKITGIDANGVLAHWFNRYNGSVWSGWCRQSNISIVHQSKTVTLSNGKAMIDCGTQNAGSYIINATAYYSDVGYITATVAIQSNRYIRIYQPEQNETLRKASYVCDYYILTVI